MTQRQGNSLCVFASLREKIWLGLLGVLVAHTKTIATSRRVRQGERGVEVFADNVSENSLTPAGRSNIGGLLNKRNRVFGYALRKGLRQTDGPFRSPAPS